MTTPAAASNLAPEGSPRRLSEWIRWSQQHGGPGRKLHYSAVSRGELPASRPGGRWFYVLPENYFEWLKTCRLETAEARRERLKLEANALYREARRL